MDGEDVREVRCPNCRHLLFKVSGIAQIEIKCHTCKTIVLWPQLDKAVAVTSVLAEFQVATSGASREI